MGTFCKYNGFIYGLHLWFVLTVFLTQYYLQNLKRTHYNDASAHSWHIGAPLASFLFPSFILCLFSSHSTPLLWFRQSTKRAPVELILIFLEQRHSGRGAEELLRTLHHKQKHTYFNAYKPTNRNKPSVSVCVCVESEVQWKTHPKVHWVLFELDQILPSAWCM